ncbi:DMT family transporter [Legionella anisa]|uniref:EamA/RhaT family transporter n=1 Tax=Legionella anisa TaxID=28082 RepID=A0AAX0WSS8_9GAMM|nr:DMT family transporter [Legionella anisa]AWN74695.1 EamA/RhaT family transporter [Legionella anisa]KTC77491.1 putative inner membrane transporter yiJE [Legionella anisa]MBN5935896.1 DMT family transporter [Legionella anisa]MCW8425184.1 DMT family transporter [Legionella anisa]MCW8449394.1 DMT family transporter [Legionella anisa]
MNILLLAFVLLVWGMNWPLMKLAMNFIPPQWFGFTRMFIGSLFLFLIVIIQKKYTFPKRGDIPHLFSVGVLQVGLFTVLVNFGLFYNGVGHAVILVYSTPLWVAPIAIIFFNERLNLIKAFGLVVGVLGIIVLFNPFDFNWSNHEALIGSAALFLSALLWAIAILHVRFVPSQSSILQLMPWHLLVGTIILGISALIFEPHPVIHWTTFSILLNLYIGTIATGLAFWGAVEMSKRFPAVTTSLSLTGVPIIGVICSLLFLGEKPTPTVLISLAMLTIGLICVILGDYQEKKARMGTVSSQL